MATRLASRPGHRVRPSIGCELLRPSGATLQQGGNPRSGARARTTRRSGSEWRPGRTMIHTAGWSEPNAFSVPAPRPPEPSFLYTVAPRNRMCQWSTAGGRGTALPGGYLPVTRAEIEDPNCPKHRRRQPPPGRLASFPRSGKPCAYGSGLRLSVSAGRPVRSP